MASTVPPFSLLLLPIFCSCNGRVHGVEQGFEVLKVETLMPSTVCIESKVPIENAVKVAHIHGPCFSSSDGRPDHDEILSRDSLRAAYLQTLQVRLATAMRNTSADALQESLQSSVRLPTTFGFFVGSPNYVVTIGIGTPKRTQTVVMDTGSHVSWLQCRPCPTCYRQHERMFDPFASSSYRNVTYNEPACAALPPGERGRTNVGTCTYHLTYDDSSVTSGFLATERLTIGAGNVELRNFVFGCSQATTGHFVGAAGLIGLGREFHSLVEQTSRRFGNVFSYCLPFDIGRTGYLVLGPSGAPSPSYTPMRPGPHGVVGLYYLDLLGISVGTQRLPISPTVFRTGGTIIDSATVISRLPAGAYRVLRDAFRRGMSRHRMVAPIGLLDTCYLIANNGTDVAFPSITLHLSGFDFLLQARHIFYVADGSTFCLAFAAQSTGNGSVIGNIQQRGMEVIYDIRAGRIGFSRGINCP